MRRMIVYFAVLLILWGSFFLPRPFGVFAAPQPAGTSDLPVLFGAYASGDLQTSISELVGMNNWLTGQGAAGVTFAGDFLSITFNPGWNIEHELDAAWNNGFIPFFNLMPSDPWEGSYYDSNCDTASEIANGNCDQKIQVFANYYKAWVKKGGGRRAFIAPLPEMNGYWARYSSDGPTFIQAFIRIRNIFENQGVPRNAVRWVFAPNGYHDPTTPWKAFEYYYPGDLYVDVIAFSSYNYGGCPADTPWRIWDTFETAMEPYLARMRKMAPSKPIFIAQTGTVDVPDDPADPNQTKSKWVFDTFDKLADYPAVRGILYFNKITSEASLVNCPNADYRVYNATSGEPGFLNIMKDARFGKWSTGDSRWDSIAFTDPSYVFADVMPSHPFSGAPNVWYYNDVHRLYNAGITGGCAVNPLRYCPENSVTRAQMAVFLLKAKNGSSYTPPNVSPTFSDTAGHWAEDWIEALKAAGITGGYPDGTYRPDNSVTRAEMAVFLLKSKYGASYTPPPVGSSSGFSDVPVTHWAASWIKQLAAEGITSGCATGLYCPENAVTRAQMAVFLVKTFGIP